jgi:hypothetical protein
MQYEGIGMYVETNLYITRKIVTPKNKTKLLSLLHPDVKILIEFVKKITL